MNSYRLSLAKNKKKYEKLVETSLLEFEKFFEFKLINAPCLIFLNSRQQFDDITGHKTPDCITGKSTFNLVFVMDESVYEKESSKKFKPFYYPLVIKHEICHSFYNQLAWKKRPVWLNEGVSIFLSGQVNFKHPINKFTNFLEFYENEEIKINNGSVYDESGFVIEKLINKFGKIKILNLIKSCRQINNNEDFLQSFKSIYGFELNYHNINKL
jgi:hypothetical protein